MSNSTTSSLAKKAAYQRPYKSRGQRREIDRRKHDEANDYRFLTRVAMAVGLVVIVALGFVAKGLMDREDPLPQSAQTLP